jgi:glutathione S-transferase
MFDLYYWPTPNGHKVTLLLEELGLPYTIKPVNIGSGDQFKPEFLAISPNNKMPALVDHQPTDGGAPQSVFESGAILLYLAEKTGRFLPADTRGRVAVLEWLFWQMAGLGPMSGQMGHFNVYAPEQIPYAIERYGNERMPQIVQADRLDIVAVQTRCYACVVQCAQCVTTRLGLAVLRREDERRRLHESQIDLSLTRAVRAQLALERGQ